MSNTYYKEIELVFRARFITVSGFIYFYALVCRNCSVIKVDEPASNTIVTQLLTNITLMH